MVLRRLTAASAAIAALTSAWFLVAFVAARAVSLPQQLTDRDFWKLSQELSEPNGTFRSDNLLSNEVWLQHVIPELLKTARTGRVYLGVGPEQNFTYIAALKPAMVFIVDVRRGNLQLHLWYKALFEISGDRVDFMSKMFAKPRPSNLTATASALDIINSYSEVPTNETLFKQNVKAVQEHLTKTRALPLSEEDLLGIETVAYQFYWFGPAITYNSSAQNNGYARRPSTMPTYADLMVATDSEGRNRGYLANEENFKVVKDLHAKNLLVPVVGNFAGPKAIRSVGKYIKERGGLVGAFYLSNVEQYLDQQALWPAFCNNVATLPLDGSSSFIRSVRGGQPSGFRGGFGPLMNLLGNMETETSSCPANAR